MNEIRGVVQRQMTLVEAGSGPWTMSMLAESLAMLRGVSGNPRPETRAVAAPANLPTGRVVDFSRIPSRSVVTIGPAAGDTSRIIGTVKYVPLQRGNGNAAPPQPAARQGGGRAPAATTPAASDVTGVRVRMLNREPSAEGASRLSREGAASISQIIVTLTLLLASAGPTSGFLAYSCDNMRNEVTSYALAPREGCWVKPSLYSTPEPRNGRILSMRDGVRFPVIKCKITETVMQADCDSRGKVRPWKVVTSEKRVPIGPVSCMEVSTSRKATLFNRTVMLAVGGTAMDTLEKRINYDRRGHCPSRGSPGASGKAYARLTVRRIVVWKREATESLIKKSITRGVNNVLPNYVAGGMDTTEGTYVWNYTVRNCPEEELEELYSGRLGILDGRTVVLGGASETQGIRLEVYRGWSRGTWTRGVTGAQEDSGGEDRGARNENRRGAATRRASTSRGKSAPGSGSRGADGPQRDPGVPPAPFGMPYCAFRVRNRGSLLTGGELQPL